MKWSYLDKAMTVVSSALSVSMMLIITLLGLAQVAFRFIFYVSVPWTEEVMRALYIYLVYFGIILIEKESGQIRTTMLIETFPPTIYKIWEAIVAAFSILFNVVVFIGCFIAIKATNIYMGSLPWVSLKLFYVPLIVSTPMMMLYQAYHAVKIFRKEKA